MNDGNPTQAGGLKDLAEVRFGKETLSDAEKLLLNKVTCGDWADCSKLNEEGNDPEEADKWGKARQIRAALVTWLCTDKRALECIHPKGIQVHGADITDALNLSFVNIPFQLTLHCCRLKDHIDLSRAEVSELDLQGSLVNGILAECVTVRHCVFLTNGFTATGEVRFLGARIGGDLDCEKGLFTNKDGCAIEATGIDVYGCVHIRNGFTASGEVRFLGAQIGGDLDCEAAAFANEGGWALNAERVDVKRQVLLKNGFTANGEVRLLGAQIGGDLDCEAAAFTNDSGLALNADGFNVKGGVFLRNGFTAKGSVRLPCAQIGSDLDCEAGTFSNAIGPALSADGVDVKGSLFLRNGFTAKGEVRLMGAQVGGDLVGDLGTFTNEDGSALNASVISVRGNVSLRGGMNAAGEEARFIAKGCVDLSLAQLGGQLACTACDFVNPGKDALRIYRSTIKSSVFFTDGFRADGRVFLGGAQIGGEFFCREGNFEKATLDLRDASVSTLDDSGLNDPVDPKPTIWPQPGDLLLDGFGYGRISSEGRVNVDKRIRWLELQPKSPFQRQPYLQLVKILRDSGDKKGSLRVLEEMEDVRRVEEDHGALAWIWGRLLKGTIGYGYYPQRAIWTLVGLIALGWSVYYKSYPEGTIAPTEQRAYEEFKKGKLPAHYPRFSASVYSLENSIPLVKLGQADKWQPDPGAASPRLLVWFLRFQIVLGWLLATFFVAGVTGIVHKE